MLLEWLRRRDVVFARMMKLHTGHAGPIVSEAEEAEASAESDLEGRAGKRGASDDLAGPRRGALRAGGLGPDRRASPAPPRTRCGPRAGSWRSSGRSASRRAPGSRRTSRSADDDTGERGARARAARAGAARSCTGRSRSAPARSPPASCCASRSSSPRRPRRRGRSAAPRTGSCSPGTRPRASGACSPTRGRSTSPPGTGATPPARRTTSSARSRGSTRPGGTGRSRSPCRPGASTSSSAPTPARRSRRTPSSCPAFPGGIVKAPGLQDGAVVVVRSASGPRAVVGQELSAAYDGREGIFHRISLVESVTLLPGVPGSVAVLRGAR